MQISFIPIVRTAQGKYKLLKSISLEIVGSEFDFVRTKRGYASQSVLATGQWYNFSVSETGIYKVTHSDLLAMGMSDPINSQQIAVFGNGGRMLPEANSAQRIDDLQEIPIMLHDGDDGKFDEGDYFLFYGLSPHTVSYNQETQRFSHTFNVYSTASTYFVTQTVGKGEKNVYRQLTIAICRLIGLLRISIFLTFMKPISLICVSQARIGSATVLT